MGPEVVSETVNSKLHLLILGGMRSLQGVQQSWLAKDLPKLNKYEYPDRNVVTLISSLYVSPH